MKNNNLFAPTGRDISTGVNQKHRQDRMFHLRGVSVRLLALFLAILYLTGCASLLSTPNRPPTKHEKRTIEMYKESGQAYRIPEYIEGLKEREE